MQQFDGSEKFQGAMVFSAIGDALGWPTELGRYPSVVQKTFGERNISDFVTWPKRVGGRYFGFEETIKEGSYSDDTQLALAVARCIDEKGDLDSDKFAYLELPLWRDYERGGGSSIKAAAETLERTQKEWVDNFYKKGKLDYRNAGANGAAMRILPIALVNINNENRLLRDIFMNSIVTHGHPRAILGAIIYSFLIKLVVRERNLQRKTVLEYLKDSINLSSKPLSEYDWFNKWISNWDRKPLNGMKFKEHFSNTRQEASDFLNAIGTMPDTEDKRYYEITGALNKTTRGSGLSTVFVAVYLFLKYINEPEKALHTAVNTIGSDTDTIANFIGGLLGAYYGLHVIQKNLLEKIQDREYILKVAKRLYKVSSGELIEEPASTRRFERKDYLLLIKAWKIGLYEMFWEALQEGSPLMHPVLGGGKIVRKEIKPLLREDYVAKLIEVSFACGQTCVFHSRVRKELSSVLAGEFPREETVEERLERLSTKGLIRLSKRRFEDFTPLKIPGKPLSEILNEIRGNE